MTSDRMLDMRRFYIKAVVAIGAIALLSYLKLPREFVAGVLAGGALSIINIRGMVKGIRQMLSIDKPSPKRMLISGIFRLLILSAVIITIAMITTINLIGLLLGFAVVPLMLAAEGLVHARKLQALDEAQGQACSNRPR